jgi:diguanylate cyclase (GGDEF)-like protein
LWLVYWHRYIPAAGLGLALLVVSTIGAVGYRTVRSQAETAAWVEHTYLVIEQLDRISLSINQAESAVRGYALSREEHLARELAPSIAQAQLAFKRAKELTRDNLRQQRRLDDLQPKLQRRIDLLNEYLSRVRGGGETRVRPEALQVSAEIKQIATEMVAQEQVLLNGRVAQRAEQTTQTLRVSGLGLFVSLMLVLGAFWLVNREMRARRRTQAALRSKHEETALLLEMGELLQASKTLDEACTVIGQFAPQFFDQQPGCMFMFNASHKLLEERSSWGSRSIAQSRAIFAADDCWALRRGQTHWYDPTTVRMPCKHVGEVGPKGSLCQPLLAQGEVLGILHVTSEEPLSDDFRKRGEIVGEQLSMALANLALREKLRNQSIRDPLTGLFNRRYTEETLDREIHRAARSAESLAVLMLDVDHFKRFNDTFGHEAGDQVLCEIGKVLTSHTRASDVVSRMGGEELLVVLPGARGEDAERKAQELRAEISKLRIVHAGRDLGEVTISIGVALHPQHGAASSELLRVADAALYAAKREGRDRVVVAA